MQIRRVWPETALPEASVRIEMEGLDDPTRVRVFVGGLQAELLGASTKAVTVRLPDADSGDIEVRNSLAARGRIRLGALLYDELHPVANPVVDRDGNVYTTYSGTRGEEVGFGVFVTRRDGETEPFLADIVNPTGLAIGSDNRLYISSRHEGEIFRTTFDKQVDKYAEGLGLATGLAFDSKGNLFAGDRSGTIFKISPEQEVEAFCELEPSVSAFHLAIDSQDILYATGPTLATQDCVYRITPEGRPEIFFKGLGRPQGVGFDPEGRLQVAASYRGKKGLYTFVDDLPELTVAGPMLVGFAYDEEAGLLYCVDSSSLFRIDLQS